MRKILLRTIAAALLMATGSKGWAEESLKSLPYQCNFSTAEMFSQDWTVVNGNEDYNQWEYIDWMEGIDGKAGCAYCSSNSNTGNNDWLISNPINMEAGDNHFRFVVKGVRADTGEELELCYGTSADTKQMTTLKRWNVKSAEWNEKIANFNLPKSGNYYFALHSVSSGFSLYIDDVLIDKGRAETHPKLEIVSLKFPESTCDYTSQTPIGLRLKNVGTGDASTFKMTYTIDGNSPVEESIETTLKPDSIQTYYFKMGADFEKVGRYVVVAKVVCNGEEQQTSGTAYHKETVTTLPFKSDFSKGMGNLWTNNSIDGWKYEGMGGYVSTNKKGTDYCLLSPCIYTEGPLRLDFAYTGGMFYTKAGVKILMGQSGTDIAKWVTVFEDYTIDRNGAEKIVDVDVQEAGYYTLAVVPASEASDTPLNLYFFNISQIYDYDLKALEAVSSFAPYTPAEHYNQKIRNTVWIENCGTEEIKGVTTSMNLGDKQCYSADHKLSLKKDEKTYVTFEGTMPKANIGDVIKDANIYVDTKDEKFSDDNKLNFSDIHLTDSVLATENITDWTYGTGIEYERARFGNVYTLNVPDTLTSVTLGLATENHYVKRNIGVAVYRLGADGHKIDRRLFSTVVERGEIGGLRTFSFPPMLLPAGNYYIEVEQITPNNVGIAYDLKNGTNTFYQSDGDSLWTISGYGSIALRANFGHNAKAYNKDASIRQFVYPAKQKALYAVNDSVGFVVSNQGAEAIKGMKVKCSIMGTEKDTIVDLLPYEQATVVFRGIDLTAVGTHTLTATVLIDGDENPVNNTLTYDIESVAEADPFKLDFESCDDFDHGTMFNPRWWTIDRVGQLTDSWAGYKYPHEEEPVGFMAFNTAATIPSMADFEGFYPHSGKRFGAAFCTSVQDTESNVWLISPQLQLQDNSSLQLFVKTFRIEFYNQPERYRILVSDTDNKFDSFSVIGGDRTAPADEWGEVNVDLSAYNGKKVYVAIQYISKCLEGVVMMVDDIEVKTGVTAISDITIDSGINVSTSADAIIIQSNPELTAVSLYDVSGKLLYNSHKTGNKVSIPTTDLNQGVFIVKAITSTGERTVKVALK